jgi:hypothetical protein
LFVWVLVFEYRSSAYAFNQLSTGGCGCIDPRFLDLGDKSEWSASGSGRLLLLSTGVNALPVSISWKDIRALKPSRRYEDMEITYPNGTRTKTLRYSSSYRLRYRCSHAYTFKIQN